MKRTALLTTMAILIGAGCGKGAELPTPITTVAAVESTEFFSNREFVLDSVNSTSDVRVYRPRDKPMRRLVQLRLWLSPEGRVTVVRVAISPAALRGMLHETLADLIGASLPPGDTASFAALLAEIHDDEQGVVAGKFAARDTSNVAMPAQPTPVFLAFLNAIPTAEEVHGGGMVRVDNLALDGDSATVLTIAAFGNQTPLGDAVGWVVKRFSDILGATPGNVEKSWMFGGEEFGAAIRDGSRIIYHGTGPYGGTTSLTLYLDDSSLVDRLAYTYPNPDRWGNGGPGTFSLLSLLTHLVPSVDSADAREIQNAGVRGTGEKLRAYIDINDVLDGKKAEAMYRLSRCMVHVRQSKQNDITIEVEQFEGYPSH